MAVVATVGWLRWLGQVALAGSARLWPALAGSGLLAGSAWPVGRLALTGWLALAVNGGEALAPLRNKFVAIYHVGPTIWKGNKNYGKDWMAVTGVFGSAWF